MWHFIRVGSTLFVKAKKIFRQKIQYFFENYNLTPLDMYNGLSQVYWHIKLGRIKNPLVYKALRDHAKMIESMLKKVHQWQKRLQTERKWYCLISQPNLWEHSVLSGRMLDLRLRGLGFEPHRRHCIVSLRKNINPSLVLVQTRKTHPYISERLLMGRKESNQTKTNQPTYIFAYKPPWNKIPE